MMPMAKVLRSGYEAKWPIGMGTVIHSQWFTFSLYVLQYPKVPQMK